MRRGVGRGGCGACCLAALLGAAAAPAVAAEAQGLRATARPLYLTNAERREAGRKHMLTPWLTAALLAEAEWRATQLRPADAGRWERDEDTAADLQLNLLAQAGGFVRAEMVLEHDVVAGDTLVDEALAAFETEAWEVEAGRMFTPLGEYYSHFASGPALEFGETRGDGIAVSHAPGERLDVKLMTYRGTRGALRWAAGVEARAGAGWLLGASYQSDLTDAEEAPVVPRGGRVPAAALFAVWTAPGVDLSLEAVGALRAQRGPPAARDRPLAWNLELAHFVHPRVSWALRWEGSRELAGAPRRRWGLAVTWRPGDRVSLTVEALRGWHVLEAAGDAASRTRGYGARLSLAF